MNSLKNLTITACIAAAVGAVVSAAVFRHLMDLTCRDCRDGYIPDDEFPDDYYDDYESFCNDYESEGEAYPGEFESDI